MHTTQIGWVDYLMFWALNIMYGVSAAFVAHGNLVYFIPLLFSGLVALAFAALILAPSDGIDV